MNLEALKQTLESLDINPDEIEDEIYAKVFRILFAIIEILSEEIDALKSENQKLRDEVNLLKGEQTKPKFVVLKRMMIFLLKMKEENEILEKAGNQVQEKTKLRSIILKPAELISLCLLYT